MKTIIKLALNYFSHPYKRDVDWSIDFKIISSFVSSLSSKLRSREIVEKVKMNCAVDSGPCAALLWSNFDWFQINTIEHYLLIRIRLNIPTVNYAAREIWFN